jgi:hypothetical protein
MSSEQHNQTLIADDGTELYGAEAVAAFSREVDAQQEQRQRFAREHPEEWARYCNLKGYVDAPLMAAVRRRAPRGRAPRVATNMRHRGSQRGTRSASSSSDDPGDSDPEPRRICACGCGASIEHKAKQARFLSHAHAVRAGRAAEREEPSRGFTPLEAPRRPACPHPCTVPDEDGDPICLVCGTLVGRPSSPNGFDKLLALMVTDEHGLYRRLRRRQTIPFVPRRPRQRRKVSTYTAGRTPSWFTDRSSEAS